MMANDTLCGAGPVSCWGRGFRVYTALGSTDLVVFRELESRVLGFMHLRTQRSQSSPRTWSPKVGSTEYILPLPRPNCSQRSPKL